MTYPAGPLAIIFSQTKALKAWLKLILYVLIINSWAESTMAFTIQVHSRVNDQVFMNTRYL